MMNKRTTDVVAYLTWVGLIIAFAAGDRQQSRFHLNQALVISLASVLVGIVSNVPLFGWLIGLVGGLFCAACWLIGIVHAAQGTEREVPLIGQIRLLF